MKTSNNMGVKKIILTGGGTGGSVTPLLALVPDFRANGWESIWVGTYKGIEKNMVAQEGITYYSIAAGKLRRYISFQNIIDPFLVFWGFFQSLFLLSRLQANVVMSAGGFVSVPVVWAAWALRIPIIIHQQDVKPGLANRLMSVCASVITVTFEKSLQDYTTKAVWTGNPVRSEFREALSFSEQKTLPVLLVLGGGTGSQAINTLVVKSLSDLTKHFLVIHISGEKISQDLKSISNYQPHSFLKAAELAKAMKQATLVVTRAGLGTLTELAYLSKPVIIIPMPYSHQEDNAYYFQKKGAAQVLDQKNCTSEQFTNAILSLAQNSSTLESLAKSINTIIKSGAREQIVALVRGVIEK